MWRSFEIRLDRPSLIETSALDETQRRLRKTEIGLVNGGIIALIATKPTVQLRNASGAVDAKSPSESVTKASSQNRHTKGRLTFEPPVAI